MMNGADGFKMCVIWRCESEPDNQFCAKHKEKPKLPYKERERIRKENARPKWPSSTPKKQIRIHIDPSDPEWEMITNEW
jgi:hypothetical protein